MSSNDVMVAYVCGEDSVPNLFPHNLASNAAMLAKEGRLYRVAWAESSQQLKARQKITNVFLDSPAQWLLWWDTDMRLGDEAALTLLRHAETNNAKAATCLGFMWRDDMTDPPRFLPVPAIYDWNVETLEYNIRWNYPQDTQFWTNATGWGFTLVHRDLWEAVGEPHYEVGPDGMGHDIHFFHRARRLTGERVLYCSDIKSKHIKPIGIGEEEYIQVLPEILAGLPPGDTALGRTTFTADG